MTELLHHACENAEILGREGFLVQYDGVAMVLPLEACPANIISEFHRKLAEFAEESLYHRYADAILDAIDPILVASFINVVDKLH